jgi:hypothetical protein
MPVTGRLFAESLAPEAVLDVPLTLHRLQRITASNPAPGQPDH